MSDESQQPEIVERGGFEVVGMETSFTPSTSKESSNAEEIGDLWGRFLERVPELGHTPGDSLYGVIRGYTAELSSEPRELRYLAGVLTPDGLEVPQGMTRWVVPATTYAVFVHKGSLDDLSDTIGWIYEEWLPSAEWVHAEEGDVELYDERFHPTSEDSELEYWISVKPKH